MILISFNGAVNVDNFKIYDDIFNDRTAINPNNCSAKGTFFVSHKYSNYSAVQVTPAVLDMFCTCNLYKVWVLYYRKMRVFIRPKRPHDCLETVLRVDAEQFQLVFNFLTRFILKHFYR